MNYTIEDGTGTGQKAKVNANGELYVLADVVPVIATISSRDEEAYVFASGDFIALTTTNTETGIFHLKNTSTTKILKVYSIRSCADVINKWKLYKNSTGGTLISDQSAGSKNNLNISSSNTPDATVYKGAEGKTVSGGTMLEHWINDVGHSTEILDGSLVLGRNDSIELTVEVAAAGDVCCRVFGYYE